MTRYLLITFVVATSIFLVRSAKVDCGPNEVEKEDIDCSSDCCPEQEGQPTACPDPCATACKCSLMFLRAANGTCINARECPPIRCGDNEEFISCPTCSELCSNASPDGQRCPRFGVSRYTVICKPACRCKDNFWRDDDNKCVPYNDCPQFQNSCD